MISCTMLMRTSTLLMMERQSKPKPEAALYRGDVVLVPFPFTDLGTEKLRPAVIASVDPQKTDVIIAFISSVVSPGELSETDYLLRQDNPDFAQTGLKKASTFRMRKLLTIERSKIIRRLGRVSPTIQKELDVRLRQAVGLH
jgi:mRNA interferase MazF